MILSDTTLKKYLKAKKIEIKPYPKDRDFKSVGIKLTLADEILVPKAKVVVDLMDGNGNVAFIKKNIQKSGYILKPGEFILGAINQQYRADRSIAGFIDGRSTLARLGLTIHGTSMVVEGNYDHFGGITLEIKNQGPFKLRLRSGMQIGMLVFFEMKEAAGKNQHFNYKGQTKVLPPDLKALKQ